MKAELKTMTRKELIKLKADIDAAIARLDTQEKKKALDAAEKAARAHGFGLAELTPLVGQQPKPKAAAKPPRPAKYCNPADKSQTWSGFGRPPAWVKAALADGKTLDDLLI